MTVEGTHRALHAVSADLEFTVRPDLCEDCRGVVIASRAQGLLSPDELLAHRSREGHALTYAELRRRLRLPDLREGRTLLARSFRERVPAPPRSR